MAATKERTEKKDRKERKGKKFQTEGKTKTTVASEEKISKKKNKSQQLPSTTLSLLAASPSLDPGLSSLFAAKPAPVQPRNLTLAEIRADDDDDDDDDLDADNDAEIKASRDEADQDEDDSQMNDVNQAEEVVAALQPDNRERKRKRKRKDAEDDLEGVYMEKLAREEEKDAKRHKKQSQPLDDGQQPGGTSDGDMENASVTSNEVSVDDEAMSPPPKHETLQATDDELAKANRTVFLGNVSTSAINSKVDRKALMNHLASFFTELPAPKSNDAKHRVESIRFRSTPYSSAIPKKAAFAKKELMDATTKSTNAYAVYSSPILSREAAKRLNGTIVLDRHLRVDEVAHPAKVDNRRCVFVGNLGFVDDESNIQDANEEEGREKRKRSKIPADAEEGLWRTFGKCGKVESVRVIRDSTTRVGKGIAYVQFEDENGVEAALLLNEKKFPPMLPRKLRVTRAKAQKKNAKPGSGRPSAKPKVHEYQRKVTGAELTQMGRAGKLFGRAAAAQAVKGGAPVPTSSIPDGIRKPENFVFEGHRASSKSGKSGLRLGKSGKSKPANRSAKRGAAFKSAKRKA